MRNLLTRATSLIVLSLILLGCGEASPAPGPDETPSEAPKPTQVALVVEASEPTYPAQGQAVAAIDEVRLLVEQLKPAADAGVTVRIDAAHQRNGQLRLLLEPTDPKAETAGPQANADPFFELLKHAFDQRAKDALINEAAYQQDRVNASAQQIKQLQQTLQAFQEERRGQPQTDASRLERRKLERAIELALAEQIAAEKQAAELKRKIDRGQFVTLVRIQ